jgi:hypothetical protein
MYKSPSKESRTLDSCKQKKKKKQKTLVEYGIVCLSSLSLAFPIAAAANQYTRPGPPVRDDTIRYDTI